MLNYFAGIQNEILGTEDLNKVYQGTMIEHLVGQELLASQFDALSSLNFWVMHGRIRLALSVSFAKTAVKLYFFTVGCLVEPGK